VVHHHYRCLCHSQPVSKWTPIWRGLQVAGHALFYLVMGLCLLAVLVLGVANLADRDRPKYWGTFTEQSTSCDPGPRGGCTATGIWTSDDGRIVRRDVLLDGSVEPGRSVRASYQPGGPSAMTPTTSCTRPCGPTQDSGCRGSSWRRSVQSRGVNDANGFATRRDADTLAGIPHR
jgi:hypothetical protein